MANYGYNMTQARLIVAIPRRFPKLLQMNESSGVDDMSGLSELRIPERISKQSQIACASFQILYLVRVLK